MCYLKNLLLRLRELSGGYVVIIPRRAAKVILSLSMILILLMCWTVAPLLSCRALITELTLVGGGEMTLSALLDLLMVAFGAAGMDGAVRNQAAATGTQPVPYIGQLLNRYLDIALDSSIPLPVWGRQIFDGLFTLANGTLYLDSDATAAVADFQRWAWSNSGGGLVVNAPVTPASDGEYTDGTHTILRLDSTLTLTSYLSNNSSSDAVTSNFLPVELTAGLYIGPMLLNNVSGQYVLPCYMYVLTQQSGTHTPGLYLMGNDASYVWVRATQGSRRLVRRGSFGLNPAEFVLAPTNFGISADNASSSIPRVTEYIRNLDNFEPATGDFLAEPDTFVGPMQQGQGTELPLGDAVTVSSDTAATMHLLNYLRAAAFAYAGTGTAQVPVTDVDTGEDELLPLSVPLDTPIGVTGVTDAAIDQSGAIAGTDAVAGDFMGTDEYTMDLTQFFPFCIPFDIVALYQKFEAEAAAPVVDWPIPIPGQEEPYLLHLDFAVFDSLAVWVRRLELIAFAVGLMVMTKRLIQGGD